MRRKHLSWVGVSSSIFELRPHSSRGERRHRQPSTGALTVLRLHNSLVQAALLA